MKTDNRVCRPNNLSPEDLNDCVTICNAQWELHLQTWLNDAMRSETMPWPEKARIESVRATWQAAWMDGFAAAIGIYKP